MLGLYLLGGTVWLTFWLVIIIGRWKIYELYLKKKFPSLKVDFKTRRGPERVFSKSKDPRTLQLIRDAYIIKAKHPEHFMYQVIEFRKFREERYREPIVNLIGIDSHTEQPYTLRCPPSFAHRSIEDCVAWCLNAYKENFTLKEV